MTLSSISPPPIDAFVCRTPQHLHCLLHAQHMQWPFPNAGAAFITSSHTKCFSSKYHSPRSTCVQGACMHDPSHVQHLQQPLPIPCTTVITSLPTTTVSSTWLSSASKPAHVWHWEYNVQHRRSTQQDGYYLLCAAHTAAVPPFSHALPASSVHSQPYTALLVDGSARRLPITSTGCVCCGDSATGWHGTEYMEVMRTPCFHQYLPSVLGILDKRRWGTTIILSATNLGGDSKTYAPPAFQIAPPPV
ncbi:hypothetical protein B0H14DRAFT_2557662 [Mycena olivaceomarginata]|nr:hypothetical protein B0H14DRAFT_2557662 [Mycena olivaceomarginata]